MGDTVRTFVQLPVSQLLVRQNERDLIGRALHLRFEQFIERSMRILRLRVIPLNQHLLLLVLVEQRQLGKTLSRIGNDACQQRAQVTEPTMNRRRIEEVGVVIHVEDQLAVLIGHVQTQIKLGRVGRDRNYLDLDVEKLHPIAAIEIESRGDERTAGIALYLEFPDQVGQRVDLMVQRI